MPGWIKERNGEHMDREKIDAKLDAAWVTHAEMAAGPEHWSRFEASSKAGQRGGDSAVESPDQVANMTRSIMVK